MTIDIMRSDANCIERWQSIGLMIGDKASIITMATNDIDDPIESSPIGEIAVSDRSKLKSKPAKRGKQRARRIGTLDCEINKSHLFLSPLTTANILSIDFVWLGDRTGRSIMYIGSEVSPTPRIPTIEFGDRVTIRTLDRQRSVQES